MNPSIEIPVTSTFLTTITDSMGSSMPEAITNVQMPPKTTRYSTTTLSLIDRPVQFTYQSTIIGDDNLRTPRIIVIEGVPSTTSESSSVYTPAVSSSPVSTLPFSPSHQQIRSLTSQSSPSPTHSSSLLVSFSTTYLHSNSPVLDSFSVPSSSLMISCSTSCKTCRKSTHIASTTNSVNLVSNKIDTNLQFSLSSVHSATSLLLVSTPYTSLYPTTTRGLEGVSTPVSVVIEQIPKSVTTLSTITSPCLVYYGNSTDTSSFLPMEGQVTPLENISSFTTPRQVLNNGVLLTNSIEELLPTQNLVIGSTSTNLDTDIATAVSSFNVDSPVSSIGSARIAFSNSETNFFQSKISLEVIPNTPVDLTLPTGLNVPNGVSANIMTDIEKPINLSSYDSSTSDNKREDTIFPNIIQIGNTLSIGSGISQSKIVLSNLDTPIPFTNNFHYTVTTATPLLSDIPKTSILPTRSTTNDFSPHNIINTNSIPSDKLDGSVLSSPNMDSSNLFLSATNIPMVSSTYINTEKDSYLSNSNLQASSLSDIYGGQTTIINSNRNVLHTNNDPTPFTGLKSEILQKPTPSSNIFSKASLVKESNGDMLETRSTNVKLTTLSMNSDINTRVLPYQQTESIISPVMTVSIYKDKGLVFPKHLSDYL